MESGRGGQESGVVTWVTGRNRVTADMSHIYFYSASRHLRCRNHSQVVPPRQKLKHSVTKIFFWGKQMTKKNFRRNKTTHTAAKPPDNTRRHHVQYLLCRCGRDSTYCWYVQNQREPLAVHINSFPSHLITSLLSLIFFFLFLAGLCWNVSPFHILHIHFSW